MDAVVVLGVDVKEEILGLFGQLVLWVEDLPYVGVLDVAELWLGDYDVLLPLLASVG